MQLIGLTGSIGMGKSLVAEMFRAEGLLVHDADAVVHDLYRGAAVPLVEAEFPGTTSHGEVDRERLAAIVLDDSAALQRLERLVHPLVARARDEFVARAAEQGAQIAVLDIPLLFETGGESLVEYIVVVSAPAAMQRQRLLSRPGMTEQKMEKILSKQMPDADKRVRADFIIENGGSIDATRAQVRRIVQICADRRKQAPHA